MSQTQVRPLSLTFVSASMIAGAAEIRSRRRGFGNHPVQTNLAGFVRAGDPPVPPAHITGQLSVGSGGTASVRFHFGFSRSIIHRVRGVRSVELHSVKT